MPHTQRVSELHLANDAAGTRGGTQHPQQRRRRITVRRRCIRCFRLAAPRLLHALPGLSLNRKVLQDRVECALSA